MPHHRGAHLQRDGNLDFSEFSRSALIRLADEIVLQMQLVGLAFTRALRRRAKPDQVNYLATRQLVGVAGITAA